MASVFFTVFCLWRLYRETRESPSAFESGCSLFWVSFGIVIPRHDTISVYLREAQILALAVLVVLLLKRAMRLPKDRFVLLAGVAAAAAFAAVVLAPRLFVRETGPAANIDSPLRGGSFFVAQGGDSVLLNGHRLGGEVTAQRFALDITKLSGLGRRTSSFLPGSALRDYLIYGVPVFSPCAGVILLKKDGLADQRAGVRNIDQPAGNYLAIGCDAGFTLVLAHLQPGIVPRMGDRVEAGQRLAAVGNTGNSTEPHLHIHAVSGRLSKERDVLFMGNGIPLSFDGIVPARNTVLTVR